MITAAGIFFLGLFSGAVGAGLSVYVVLLLVDWRETRSERLPFDYAPVSYAPKHVPTVRLSVAPTGDAS